MNFKNGRWSIYIKWGYNIEFLIQKKTIKLIQHGYLPFYVDSFDEMRFYPYNSPEFVLEGKYYYPKDLDEFKKVKIRKRNLVCHYTKRETAIEKILFTKTLRFNELKNTNDPWEYKKNIYPSIKKGNDLFLAIGKSFETQFQSEKVKSISFTKEISNIRCFENQLMWAHYSENHKGVCLIFDERKLKKLFEKQFLRNERLNRHIMNYADFPSKVCIEDYDNPIETMNNNSKELFFTKQKVWRYESEYRLMIFPDEKKETLLEKIDEALYAIIIGINFPDIYKIIIQDFHRKYYSKAKLYQMHWDSKGYFKVHDINSTDAKFRCSEVLNDYIIKI